MDFLQQAFPGVDIAIAHGQVIPPWDNVPYTLVYWSKVQG